MAITSSLGIGSGMDINGIVSQLIQAEGQPAFNAIDRKEDQANSKVSALGRLKSALSDFRTATGKLKEGGAFSQHKTNLTDEDKDAAMVASTGLGAAAGVYSMEIQQLAEAHKLTSKGYSGYDAVVGTGELTFSVGSNNFSITLDGTNNTLEGVRDAINTASENSSVNASIINVDDGAGGTVSKLVLTSEETGTANNIAVSASGSAGLSDLTYTAGGSGGMTQQNEAKDAIILVDGQQATRSSNSITDVIQGVTLDLKTAEVGKAFDLNVSLDEENIKEVTDAFVSAYNGLMTVVKDLGKYDAEGGEAGALVGNSTLRSVQSQMRQAVSDSVSSATGDFNSLAMIGITIDRHGVMSLNNSDFSDSLSNNRNAVSDVFSSEQGVAARLDTRLDQYLQSGGTFDLQTTSLKDQLREYSDERDSVQLRLDDMERVLMKQFIAMDVAVGQFQSTGAYLAGQLANL
ncbi:MAG: flagellar filament capping protein FliD [Methylococcales bacterium]|nr:flagellar filament capping protein FliD [Methylococcales bacterium]